MCMFIIVLKYTLLRIQILKNSNIPYTKLIYLNWVTIYIYCIYPNISSEIRKSLKNRLGIGNI